jgi:hypothetical protein
MLESDSKMFNYSVAEKQPKMITFKETSSICTNYKQILLAYKQCELLVDVQQSMYKAQEESFRPARVMFVNKI